jgi:hypothetical protein
MSDDQSSKRRSEADAELERDVRKDRKFSLSEAIGRMAGPGAMKGASPVTRQQQAEARIGDCLQACLGSGCGCLRVVMLRHVMGSERLLSNLDQPLFVLAGYVQGVLGSEYLLKELVRETDVEWGRVYGERPYFEREGSSPHPDDPYTMASVRGTLTRLTEELSAVLETT